MATEEGQRQWHRLFGLLLRDVFIDSPVTVEVERDLSIQQQFLDVIVVRRGDGPMAVRLPDGLNELVDHNLISFKSHHEALDDWALKELLGHYVAYRKLVSPSPSALLPEERFRLFAVCARFPHNLSSQVPWQERQPGVYDCRWGTDTVRVVVAGQLPREPHNAPLHLFSASSELLGFGRVNYRPRSKRTSRVLRQLVEGFRGEGVVMSYTIEDFERDYFKEHFPRLTGEEQREVVQALPPEQLRDLLAALPPEKRLAGLPPEERLAGLRLEDRLAGLSAEQLQQYLDQLKAGRSAQPRKPRRKK